MPIYKYRNPKTGKLVEVFQNMNSTHKFTDKDGLEYERVFEMSNISKDNRIKEFSSNDFVRKSKEKNMSLGEMWSLSKEMSIKRKQKEGKDQIKKDYLAKKNKKTKQ